MDINVVSEISGIRRTLGTLRTDLDAEIDERKKEGATIMQAIEAILKTINQETEDHIRQLHETKKMFMDAKNGIIALSGEMKQQQESNEQFLYSVNALKAALDQDQNEHGNKHKEYVAWLKDVRASIEDIQRECEKQQKTNEELTYVLNSLKAIDDQAAIERIDNRAKIDKHIAHTESLRDSIMEHINSSLVDVRKDATSQRNATHELLGVVNALKDAFDNEQHEGIVKHTDILKCIEDTHSTVTDAIPAAKNRPLTDRLRQLRMEAHSSLVNPDTSRATQPIPSSNQMASPAFQHATVPTPPCASNTVTTIAEQASIIDADMLKDAVMREVAQLSISSTISREALKEAVVEEVAQATKKTMEALEQERKDREERYLLLHSQLANFQYDFAVERQERTQLHGELISMKSELSHKVEAVSQDMRAIQATEKQAAQLPLVAPSGTVDVSAMTDTIKLEVARAIGEHKMAFKDGIDQLRSAAAQEKSFHASDFLGIQTKIAGLANEFTARIGHLEMLSSLDKSKIRYADEDLITRSEFEDQCRHILGAVGQDSNSMPKEEFEDHLQRIWEAIMQLQAKQLDDLRQRTREAALSNGVASDMSQSGSARKALNRVVPSSANSTEKQSSPLSRQSGSSPYRSSLRTSTLASGQQSPQSGGPNIFTGPAAILNDNAIATSQMPLTASDAQTPRTSAMKQTQGIAQFRYQR